MGHVALELHYGQYDHQHHNWLMRICNKLNIAMVACGDVHMHQRQRRALQDVLTCIRCHCTLDNAGRQLFPNGERHLRNLDALRATYPAALLQNSVRIADQCTFKLSELNYQYPHEVVPAGMAASVYLRKLTYEGMQWRWPEGIKDTVREQIDHELELINQMQYEHYFLTVYDIVRFARSQHILCQGRGSARQFSSVFLFGHNRGGPGTHQYAV